MQNRFKFCGELHFAVGCDIQFTGQQQNVEADQLLPVPEFIDPVFVKTSPKRSFSVIQNERFGLVFVKTGSIISGTGLELGTDGLSQYKSSLPGHSPPAKLGRTHCWAGSLRPSASVGWSSAKPPISYLLLLLSCINYLLPIPLQATR
jgi:hypothetical protein